MTSIPIANSASPMPMIAGITSGRFTTRVTMSRTTPKTNAGTHRVSSAWRRRSSSVRRYGWMLAATPMPPFVSSHPVPARKPPTTGYGTNRTRLPSLNVPITRKVTPVRSVTTMVAATTVRKARLRLPNASRAVVVATTASTAAAASCTLPTTPREPARHARIASVSAAATRYRPMPLARKSREVAAEHQGGERDR